MGTLFLLRLKSRHQTKLQLEVITLKNQPAIHCKLELEQRKGQLQGQRKNLTLINQIPINLNTRLAPQPKKISARKTIIKGSLLEEFRPKIKCLLVSISLVKIENEIGTYFICISIIATLASPREAYNLQPCFKSLFFKSYI